MLMLNAVMKLDHDLAVPDRQRPAEARREEELDAVEF